MLVLVLAAAFLGALGAEVEEEVAVKEVVSLRVEAALELALVEPVAVAVLLALSVFDCSIAERSSERNKRARRGRMEVLYEKLRSTAGGGRRFPATTYRLVPKLTTLPKT